MTKQSGYGAGMNGESGSGYSRKPNYNEEMSMEQLAKKALEETIRDGGAFARENPDQFKQ
ncbi:hypothetical protein WQ57_19515 [Mesobacillus campisalis]|uniref:Uncharacterized protein n=1 Tax=Mesobacillus campisalis TaxID=1408103 RepID=A0A0M2STR9_9BACI|nr:hypothetical protein [Mesobacillus campisalis]KKK36372.1 hypothetical protein WQ57_19515 [Mesobacillus campisalis]